MSELTHLSGAQQRTYEKIFHQPVADDVRRSAVRSLLEALGEVSTDVEDREEARRNGHVLVLSPREAAMETTEEVMALRHFLTRSERPLDGTNGREPHLLLVIGRRAFCLFRAEVYGGGIEQLLGGCEQEDYAAAVRAAESGDGAEMIGPCAFFEPIAEALRNAGRMLVVGESRGARLEMDYFFGWLTREHPDLAGRIVGSLVLSDPAPGSGKLLERARDFFCHARHV